MERTRSRRRTRLTGLGINPNVVLLGVISFFADVAGEMIYPLVPVFLTVTLGAPPSALGLVEGVAESASSLLRVVSGWISDRIGRRKPLVVIGYALAAVAKPLLGLAYSWPVVLLARTTDRIGKGLRTAPRDALISDWTPPETRGRAYGFSRMLDTSGAVVGPLIALLALRLLSNNLRLLFVIAVIPASVAALLTLGIRDRRPAPATKPARLSLRLAGYDRSYKAFLLVTLVFALGNSSDAFLILRAKALGLSTTMVVLAYVLYNAVYAALAFPAGIRSDVIGRRRVLLVGLLLFAAVYLGFGVVSRAGLLWVLFAVYGAYMALTDGIGRALVTDLVPEERRGTALGLYSTILGISALAASVVAGLLWDRVAPAAPFLYGAVAALIAAVLLVTLLPDRVTRGGA